jgi:hypothetical protein
VGNIARASAMMRIRTVGAAIVLLLVASAAATDYPPADHSSGSLTMSSGDRMWGLHTGLTTFTVPAGAMAQVMPYGGAVSHPRGMLEICADSIEIAGTLSARGAGYTGGGGGGGGAACMYVKIGNFLQLVCSSGGGSYGQPDYGSRLGLEFPFFGFSGATGCEGSCWGGLGGFGDGAFGGIPERSGSAAQPDGGYAGPQANGDFSMDDQTTMGSGGAGGKGGSGYSAPLPGGGTDLINGGGGGGGGRGGGTIRLVAARSFLLRSGGLIDASGVMGQNAVALGGGNTSPPQSGLAAPGGGSTSGGRGAGGGILLDVRSAQSAVIEQGAIVQSLGGNSHTLNGGTIKIRRNTLGGWQNSGSLLAGRVAIHPPPGAAAAMDWHMLE